MTLVARVAEMSDVEDGLAVSRGDGGGEGEELERRWSSGGPGGPVKDMSR